MAIDFPASPTNGQTFVVGSVTYTWDTVKWTAVAAGGGGGGGSGDKIEEGNTSAVVIDTGKDGRFVVKTEGKERVRFDASGRLLVGTSSEVTGALAQYGSLHVIGNISNPFDRAAIVAVGRSTASASIARDDALGQLMFTDNAAGEYAYIQAVADATAGPGNYPGRLSFSTTAVGASTPTERMRINNSGRTYLFDSSGAVIHAASGKAAGTGDYIFIGTHNASAIDTGTIGFAVYSNGNVQNTNGSYTSLSDAKLKENIVDAGSQWDDLKAIKIRNWNFKAETGHETHRQIGLIAQELETVCPGLVFETPDRDNDGNDLGTTTKGVNQSVLYMKAVKALQEAMERIEALEAKVAVLETK